MACRCDWFDFPNPSDAFPAARAILNKDSSHCNYKSEWENDACVYLSSAGSFKPAQCSLISSERIGTQCVWDSIYLSESLAFLFVVGLVLLSFFRKRRWVRTSAIWLFPVITASTLTLVGTLENSTAFVPIEFGQYLWLIHIMVWLVATFLFFNAKRTAKQILIGILLFPLFALPAIFLVNGKFPSMLDDDCEVICRPKELGNDNSLQKALLELKKSRE